MPGKIIFEVTVEEPAKRDLYSSDKEEEENIANCILDGLGFPENVKVTAKVISKETNG